MTAPAAIAAGQPIVTDLCGALEDTTCRIERIRVLMSSALGEAHDIAVSLPERGGEISEAAVGRTVDNWIILEVVGELFADLERRVVAINEHALRVRAEVSA